MTSVFPTSTAVTTTDTTLDQMIAEIEAKLAEFEAANPEFASTVKAIDGEAPMGLLATPVLSADDAAAHVRDSVIYETPADEYADFLVDLYTLYKSQGPLGVAALKTLSGAEIAELVADGTIPSHEAYKKFNLLGFYASLRDDDNVQWLLDQPKTNVRAENRVREVIEGVTPQMREDAAKLLGEVMAKMYAEILVQEPGIAGMHAAIETPPAPPIEETREGIQAAERLAVQEARYSLEQVMPLVTDVKLTAMNELTLVLNTLTSLTEIYRTLETYYYSYNYYYHYERMERTWWYMLYIVDHIEQRDTVQYQILTENVYKLLEYVYNYNDLINVQGLISGVLGLEYEKVVPAELQDTMVDGAFDAVENPPEEVAILLDFVVPFAFDITDELNLYYLEEVVNEVINIVRSETHFYWEYHIRNYWYWDPLGEEEAPFADAILNTANEYLVSVAEDLDVGKVLNVIPVTNMFREASINFFAPAAEYPLLEKAVYLDPAPVAFMPNQGAPGATAMKVQEFTHVGPAPNAFDARANAFRFTDNLVANADAQTENLLGAYAGLANLLGLTVGDVTALYALIPEEIRINLPDLTVPEAPDATLPERVDSGIDGYQVVGWDSSALVSFVPQFAFAGVRAMPTVDEGQPILVNVNARGLGTPVTFKVDLTTPALAAVNDAVAELGAGEVPAVSVPGAPGVGGAVPAVAQPVVNWATETASWGAATLSWVTDRLS